MRTTHLIIFCLLFVSSHVAVSEETRGRGSQKNTDSDKIESWDKRLKYATSLSISQYNIISTTDTGAANLNGNSNDFNLTTKYLDGKKNYKVGIDVKNMIAPKNVFKINPGNLILNNYYVGLEYAHDSRRYLEFGGGLKETPVFYFDDLNGLILDEAMSPYLLIRLTYKFNDDVSVIANANHSFSSENSTTKIISSDGYGLEVRRRIHSTKGDPEASLLNRQRGTSLFLNFLKTFTETKSTYINNSYSDTLSNSMKNELTEVAIGVLFEF